MFYACSDNKCSFGWQYLVWNWLSLYNTQLSLWKEETYSLYPPLIWGKMSIFIKDLNYNWPTQFRSVFNTQCHRENDACVVLKFLYRFESKPIISPNLLNSAVQRIPAWKQSAIHCDSSPLTTLLLTSGKIWLSLRLFAHHIQGYFHNCKTRNILLKWCIKFCNSKVVLKYN